MVAKVELHQLVDAMTEEQAAKLVGVFKRVGGPSVSSERTYARDRKVVGEALEQFANSNAAILAELAK